MSIVRVHKTANFTVMSNYHFKEKRMSLKAKGLLSLMLSLPDDWNYSISGLVKLSKDGKDSVMAALGELERFGYLTRVRTTNAKGQFSGVEYNIFEQPQLGDPVADSQNSVNQNEDIANAEKPPQLNTNKSNNNNQELTELNTKKKIEINIEDYNSILLDVKDNNLRNLYVDYIEMRRNIGSPMTLRGLNMLKNRCERISNFNIHRQKLLLEAAIINNWKNVYLPKEEDIKEENLRMLKNFYS